MTKNTFGIVFTRFMETIHIELTNKAVYFFVSEVLW